ncbi:MAG: hypothetical protein C0392_00380 [Syntrophus sp. (in: bacteria)]|nr:hypothetical protein [Syntrophus sp. (in: bacteria)]
MNNDKGVILVVVLAVSLMVMILAAAAIKMSELGYLAYGSEKRYQVASAASEHGINVGIKAVVDGVVDSITRCPVAAAGTLSTGGVNAGYSYFAISAGSRCFIHSTGTFGDARIVKNVIIPAAISQGAQYGALTMRNGGTVVLGGSAAIVSCSSTCEGPGMMYGGSVTLTAKGGLIDDPATCPNNPKGIYGSPYAVVNKDGNNCSVSSGAITCPASDPLGDLVPTIFKSTDWTDLVNDSAGTYNGHAVNVTNLTVSAMPASPTVPSPTCTCTDSSLTLISTTNSCTGVASFAACGGQIKFNGTLAIQSIPASITSIVSAGNVTASSVPSGDTSFQNKSIYATGSANITINNGNVKLNGSTISAGGTLTLTDIGDIMNGSVLSSGGDLVMASVAKINDPAQTGLATVSIISGGNITLKSAMGIDKADVIGTGTNSSITIANSGSDYISNSMLVTAGTNGDITMNGGTMSNNTLVTRDVFTVNTMSGIVDTNVFSKTTVLTQTNYDIAGGLLYSQNATSSTGSGNGQVGTSSNPTLLLAGGNLTLGHSGTTNFNGLMFANGQINYTATGNFNVSGAIIGNSTSNNTINTTGNQSISYNPTILTALTSRLSGIMNAYSCGGSASVNRQFYISTTKTTVY